MPPTFLHSGCFGDIIYGLPCVWALGPGHVYLADRPWTKPLLFRHEAIADLLNAQRGISCSRYDGSKVDFDLSTFRNGGQRFGETIVNRHARWMRTKVDISKPWITAEADPGTKGKIVINRSARWQGFQFPWREIVRFFKGDLLFVGLEDEHKAFCKEFGNVSLYPTRTLLDVARAIQGAELFVGNQSSPNAVAEALHKDSILEVCSYACDCYFHRKNVTHYIDGPLHIVGCGKVFNYSGRPEAFGFKFEVNDHAITSSLAMHCELMAKAEFIRQGLQDPPEIVPIPFYAEPAYA